MTSPFFFDFFAAGGLQPAVLAYLLGTEMKRFVMTAVAVMAAVGAFALEPVKLNEPDLDRGGSLMRALADRRSVREYADRALSLQDMSDLLWAANGVNRPASGKRTAPSAMDRRDIQIYVLTDKGVYLYVPEQSLLQPVAEGDHRQDVRGNKPAVNLVLVAEDGSSRFADTDAGYVSQNIFLACTSLGLATVSCGSMDEPAFRKACRLNDRQRIILFHPVGYPR